MAGKPTIFSVCLQSATEISTRPLCLPTFPDTVAELQLHIETEFSVPRCCQSVLFEGVQLQGDDSLLVHRVRNGDTFHVRYESEGDVEDIREVVESMQEVFTFIQVFYGLHPEYYHPNLEFTRDNVLNLILLLDQHVKPEIVECLAIHYFHPAKSPRAIANRLLFLDVDGLAILHELHTVAVKYPWELTAISLQHLEQAILRVLWNITASFDVRLQVLKYQFLELCVKSALRVPIRSNKEVMAPQHLARSGDQTALTMQEQDLILAENIYKAFGVLFNLAELRQCQVEIASKPGLLKQAMMIAICPSYRYIASLVSIAGMMCLAYNRETHPYLVKDDILWQVLEAVNMQRALHGTTVIEAHENRKLLRYFASLLVVQLIAFSLPLIPKETLSHLCWMIQQFLLTANPQSLHKHECDIGYVWSTVKPHVNLVYLPMRTVALHDIVISIPAEGSLRRQINLTSCINIVEESDPVEYGADSTRTYRVDVNDLLLQCAEVGVISLQNMMLREETRNILEKEEQIDFIVCMPWFLPQDSNPQKRACQLVTALGNVMKLEPPSLLNIARAKLAADTFGLEQMLNTYSLHDLINHTSVQKS